MGQGVPVVKEEARQVEQHKKWLLPHTMVDSEAALQTFLSIIDTVAVGYEVDLFLDTEGRNGHGRDANLSLVLVKSASLNKTWALDAQVLGAKVFSTPSTMGKKRTFKQICEDEKIPKVCFDVKANSDSIYGRFGVHMRGVIDLQTMEIAVREDHRGYLHSLDRCISELPRHRLPRLTTQAWDEVKQVGKTYCCLKLLATGSNAFDERPLAEELCNYAINDVNLMPILFTHYSEELLKDGDGMMRLVLKISRDRIEESISSSYGGDTADHQFAPEEMLRACDREMDDYSVWYE